MFRMRSPDTDLLNLSSAFSRSAKKWRRTSCLRFPPASRKDAAHRGPGDLGAHVPLRLGHAAGGLGGQDGPADKAGIEEEDVIVGAEGGPSFTHQKECDDFIRAHPKEKVRLRLRREDKEKVVIVVPQPYQP